jgi:CopG family nickel-responsive transcriptional regulator
MDKVSRFGVSLETSLLNKFDPLLKKKGYKSRSEAIRDLIRERLVAEEWSLGDYKTIGVLSLLYNHHVRELSESLNRIQHQNLKLIISSTHIHVDNHNCLEVVILKGKSSQIKKVSDELLSTRGVKHGKLIMTTTGSQIE